MVSYILFLYRKVALLLQRVPIVDEACKPPMVVTEEKLGLLWPQPQSIVQKEGKPFRPKPTLPVFISAGVGSGKIWTGFFFSEWYASCSI